MTIVPYYLCYPSASRHSHHSCPSSGAHSSCPLCCRCLLMPTSCFLAPSIFLYSATTVRFLKHKSQLLHSHFYRVCRTKFKLWHCMLPLHDIFPPNYLHLPALTLANTLHSASDARGPAILVRPPTGQAPSRYLPVHILFSQPGANPVAPSDATLLPGLYDAALGWHVESFSTSQRCAKKTNKNKS